MLRTFFRQGSLYLATTLFASFINLLALPIYAHVFTPGEFGVYEMITVFAGLAGIVIVLEVSQGIARYYPGATSDEERRAYASSALWFTFGSYSLFCILCAAAAKPIAAWLLGSQEHAGVFRVALLSVWSNGICYLLQNQLRWQLQARQHAISAVVVTLVAQGSAIFLVIALDFRVEGLFLGLFLGGVVGSVVTYYFGRKNFVAKIDWNTLRVMLQFSAPMALSGVAVFLGHYADRIVIKQLMSLEDVGTYSVAARFAAFASVFLVAFQSALLPLITTFHQEARTRDDLSRIFRYFLACALPAVFALAVFSGEIMLLVAGEQYASAHSLMPILATGTLLSGMYVFAPGLWLAKRTTWMLQINVATALLAVALNLVLIPRWGTLGAALATSAGGLANFAAFFVAGQYTYHLPVAYGRILLAAVLCLLLSLVGSGLLPAHAYPEKAAFLVLGVLVVSAPLLSLAEARRLTFRAMGEIRGRGEPR